MLLVSAQARIRLRGIHLTRPLRSAGGCLDPERVIWNHGFGTNLGVLLTKGLKPGRSIIDHRALKPVSLSPVHQVALFTTATRWSPISIGVWVLSHSLRATPFSRGHFVFRSWIRSPWATKRTGRCSFLVEYGHRGSESLGGYLRYRAGQLACIWLRHRLLTVVGVHPLP